MHSHPVIFITAPDINVLALVIGQTPYVINMHIYDKCDCMYDRFRGLPMDYPRVTSGVPYGVIRKFVKFCIFIKILKGKLAHCEEAP